MNLESLRPALERAGDGAFVIGADGCITLWNRAAERILGYPARAVLGRPCCDLFGGTDDSGNRLCYRGCHIQSLVRLGEPVRWWRGRGVIMPGQPFDIGHIDPDGGNDLSNLAPEHRHAVDGCCKGNRSHGGTLGARRAHARSSKAERASTWAL